MFLRILSYVLLLKMFILFIVIFFFVFYILVSIFYQCKYQNQHSYKGLGVQYRRSCYSESFTQQNAEYIRELQFVGESKLTINYSIWYAFIAIAISHSHSHYSELIIFLNAHDGLEKTVLKFTKTIYSVEANVHEETLVYLQVAKSWVLVCNQIPISRMKYLK